MLRQIQNDLFDAGADLSTPVVENPEYPAAAGHRRLRRSTRGMVRRIQRAATGAEFLCAARVVTAFSALLHVARTEVRRAERSAWAAVAGSHSGLGQRAAGEVPEPALRSAVHPVAGGQPGR